MNEVDTDGYVLNRVVSVPVFFIGMYALVKGKCLLFVMVYRTQPPPDLPTYYPMLIAYSAYATITTTTTTTLTLAVPTKADMGLSPEMAFYAMPVDEKKQVVIANAVFLAVPIVMLLDMSMRTIGLVKKGLQAERQKKRV
jgi:EXPERA (EXPanded EBP superfamily)